MTTPPDPRDVLLPIADFVSLVKTVCDKACVTSSQARRNDINQLRSELLAAINSAMRSAHRPESRDGESLRSPVNFTLGNGDRMDAFVSDGPFGTQGMRLRVTVMRGTMLVVPIAGNCVEITTIDGAARERANVHETIVERDKKRIEPKERP